MLKISNVKISGNGYFEISQSSLISVSQIINPPNIPETKIDKLITLFQLLSLMATNLLILLQFEIYSRTNDNTN